MKTVSAHDVLGLDTISKGNNKPWDKLISYMEENGVDEKVNFDFRGMEIIQPCSSDSFLKLLANPNFCMTLHNNANVAGSIIIMCTLNNQDTSRIVNEDDVIEPVESPEDKAAREMAKQLLEYFETNGEVGTLQIHKRFDQIGVPKTVRYIREAMKLYADETGIKNIILNTEMMGIQPGVMEEVANLVNDMKEIGVHLTIRTENQDVKIKIGMYHGLGDSSYSVVEKLEIMKARLVIGRVGILTRYKEGRAKDEFGRQGKGEKASTRIAIFMGFSKGDNTIIAKFRSFNNHTFYTMDHWYLGHDGEILNKPAYDDIEIPIEQLGIYNDFVGTKYHFSTAIQYATGGEIVMYHVGDNGSVIGQTYTIPERAKAVFDNFGIDYDSESLNAYIEETKRILSKE